MSDELDRECHRVAETPGGGETPASLECDSVRRGREHGLREGACGDQSPPRDTRPDRAARFVETGFGTLSYSELAPILAERVLRAEGCTGRLPAMRGSSTQDVWRMKKLYVDHSSNTFLSQVVRECQ